MAVVVDFELPRHSKLNVDRCFNKDEKSNCISNATDSSLKFTIGNYLQLLAQQFSMHRQKIVQERALGNR